MQWRRFLRSSWPMVIVSFAAAAVDIFLGTPWGICVAGGGMYFVASFHEYFMWADGKRDDHIALFRRDTFVRKDLTRY